MNHQPKLSTQSGFSPASRVWVYMCNRPLSDAEAKEAGSQLEAFCRQWTAHNQSLQATSEIFANQCVILMVDESQAGASGCSIDKSVHFLEQLGDALNVDFFDRMRFAWVNEAGVLQFAAKHEFARAVKENRIDADTLTLNTLVQSRQELQDKWLQPFGRSWHRRIVAVD